ncbi:hypothetical protein DFH28DRAFT_1078402 [Melampsora americana]|nr:hypothetical protein DFH28DRAFT_1078402 [Melampsora americana]
MRTNHQMKRVADPYVGTPVNLDRVVVKSKVNAERARGITAAERRKKSQQDVDTSNSDGSETDGAFLEVESMNLKQLRQKLKPFNITGIGKMRRPELLQVWHLFSSGGISGSDKDRHLVRLRPRRGRNQEVTRAELDSGSAHSSDTNHGTQRVSSRCSSPEDGPATNEMMPRSQNSKGHRRKTPRHIPDSDNEKQSATESLSNLPSGMPSIRRSAVEIEPINFFPSRERGTALPRPRPTVLSANAKEKQRAIDSGSDYTPEENESLGSSEDEFNDKEMDNMDGDICSDDQQSPQEDSSTHDRGSINQILDDLENPMEEDSDTNNKDENYKRLEKGQKKTDRRVSQLARAIRGMADVLKQVQADISAGTTSRGRGGKKKPQGGDFLRRIRSHIWTLMGLKKSDRLPPGASEQERARWKRRLPKNFVSLSLDLDEDDDLEEDGRDPRFPYRGGPGGEDSNPQVLLIMWKMMRSVGVRSFRPLWDQTMGSGENKFLWQLATAIFIRLVQSGEYDDITNAEAQTKVVYDAITKHARQRLQRCYREYMTLSGAELEARQKYGVRMARLTCLKNRRCTTATSLEQMWPLCTLIKAASSDDETDDDEDNAGEGQKRCRILAMPWRSVALEDLLLRLDAYHDRKKRDSPQGTRGAKPRIRLREREEYRKESRLPAPCGLPIDCYSPEWLSNLDPEGREALDIDEEPALIPLQNQANTLRL